jgi:hypothetical protein
VRKKIKLRAGLTHKLSALFYGNAHSLRGQQFDWSI